MMNNWKDLFVSFALLGGVSFILFALLDRVSLQTSQVSDNNKLSPDWEKTSRVISETCLSADDARNTNGEMLYWQSFGHVMYANSGLKGFGLSGAELDKVLKGICDAHAGKLNPVIIPMAMENQGKFFAKRETDQIEKTKKEGEAYTDKKLSEGGWLKTVSGLAYKIIRPGNSKRAKDGDTVYMIFMIKFINGQVIECAEVASLIVGTGLAGISEMLKLVGENGRIEAIIPPELGNNDKTMKVVPLGSTLVCYLEIHRIIPQTPEKDGPGETKTTPQTLDIPQTTPQTPEKDGPGETKTIPQTLDIPQITPQILEKEEPKNKETPKPAA
jgi:FKBP-type peptidyl-prolyl cis-trans isomerase